MAYDVDSMLDYRDDNATSIRRMYAPSTVGDNPYDAGPGGPRRMPGVIPNGGMSDNDMYGLPVERNRAYFGNPIPGQGVQPDLPGGQFDYTMGSLMTPWDREAPVYHAPHIAPFTFADFEAPVLSETNDPGYKFRLEQGLDTLQNRASAQGIRGGDVAKAFEDYAQDYASSEYSKVFDREYRTYIDDRDREFNAYLADAENIFRSAGMDWQMGTQAYAMDEASFRSNQNDQFARLLALMGVGSNALGNLDQLGSATHGTMSDLWLNSGRSTAGSQVAQGTLWGNMFGNAGSQWGTIPLASNILGPGGQPPGLPYVDPTLFGVPS